MITRRNAFSKAILDRKFEIDGHPMDFRSFLKMNNFYGPAPAKISANQVRTVVDLEPGEVVFIANVEVKRLT